jgi:hypothetical protein
MPASVPAFFPDAASAAWMGSIVGQLVKLRAGWKPARGPIVNRPAGFHPAPQKKDMFTRSGC